MAENPVLVEWTGRFGLPPFAAITDADFEPAFAAALTEARANIAGGCRGWRRCCKGVGWISRG